MLIMSHVQNFHSELLKDPPQGHDAFPTMRLTHQMLAQKAVQLEAWKLRMTSLEQRMQNIINLVSDRYTLSRSLNLTVVYSVLQHRDPI